MTVSRLSVGGSNAIELGPMNVGLEIVTPTSIANSDGSASAAGGQVTFSAVSSVSVNNCFSSTYDNYLLNILTVGSVSNYLDFRLRVAGTDATGANYNYAQVINGTPTTSAGNTFTRISAQETTDSNAATAVIYRPFLAERTVGLSDGYNPIQWNFSWAFAHTLTTSYDGFTLFAEGGVGTITGNVRVYGYKNS